jgi:hypothetical protein
VTSTSSSSSTSTTPRSPSGATLSGSSGSPSTGGPSRNTLRTSATNPAAPSSSWTVRERRVVDRGQRRAARSRASPTSVRAPERVAAASASAATSRSSAVAGSSPNTTPSTRAPAAARTGAQIGSGPCELTVELPDRAAGDVLDEPPFQEGDHRGGVPGPQGCVETTRRFVGVGLLAPGCGRPVAARQRDHRSPCPPRSPHASRATPQPQATSPRPRSPRPAAGCRRSRPGPRPAPRRPCPRCAGACGARSRLPVPVRRIADDPGGGAAHEVGVVDQPTSRQWHLSATRAAPISQRPRAGTHAEIHGFGADTDIEVDQQRRGGAHRHADRICPAVSPERLDRPAPGGCHPETSRNGSCSASARIERHDADQQGDPRDPQRLAGEHLDRATERGQRAAPLHDGDRDDQGGQRDEPAMPSRYSGSTTSTNAIDPEDRDHEQDHAAERHGDRDRDPEQTPRRNEATSVGSRTRNATAGARRPAGCPGRPPAAAPRPRPRRPATAGSRAAR